MSVSGGTLPLTVKLASLVQQVWHWAEFVPVSGGIQASVFYVNAVLEPLS